MKMITLEEAKQNLENVFVQVIADAEPAVVQVGTGQQVVLLSMDEYSAWQETLYLLSNPANAAHLRRSIAEARAGKVVEHELVEG